MRHMLYSLIAAALITGSGPTAFAEETVCDGSLPDLTVDNLRVPEGARCRLTGTHVQGTVKVEGGATLKAAGIDVAGNVQAEGARLVKIALSTIGGSVQLVQGKSVLLTTTTVGGDVLLDSNSGPLKLKTNAIAGNLQVFQNTGGVAIKRNEIDGNLQCKANSPAPRGCRNVVHGNAEDQCATFGGNGGPEPSGPDQPPPPDGACHFAAVTLGDDVEIPAGASCTMEGTRILGNLKLGRDASVIAIDVFVDGNVQAQGAAFLGLTASEVRGNVQFEQGGSAEVRGTTVNGNLELYSNRGALLAQANRIGGNLQAFQNQGGPSITFVDNTIGGNLQCKENVPLPAGGGNVVDGNKEDQCAPL